MALVGSLTATAQATSPIDVNNRPNPIPNQVNAQLDPVYLSLADPGCMIATPAQPSLTALFRAARQDGIDLGHGDCYRPYDQQVAARNNACGRGACPCAAVPGTSQHGWGKAVDFYANGYQIDNFTSRAFVWMRANAGRYGWNHPAFGEPGGACEEPWHWEWVGDGGQLGLDQVRYDAIGINPSPTGSGYRIFGATGWIHAHGDSVDAGSNEYPPLSGRVAGSAQTPSGKGYWLATSTGAVYAFGDAAYLGGANTLPLRKPIVGMAATPTGNGYWLVASDGGIFTYGDATFHGSAGAIVLNKPVVGMSSTPTGNGYWFVASDGGIFTYGDATFHGSAGAIVLNEPITAMAATKSGHGYWLVAVDGGIFTFGDATFHGVS